MTWKPLLDAHSVRPHATSQRELDDLRALIDRDLHDAGVAGLSTDRSFATSVQRGPPVGQDGRRLCGLPSRREARSPPGGFSAAELAIGPSIAGLIAYFETAGGSGTSSTTTPRTSSATPRPRRSSIRPASSSRRSRTGSRRTTRASCRDRPSGVIMGHLDFPTVGVISGYPLSRPQGCPLPAPWTASLPAFRSLVEYGGTSGRR